MRRLLAFLSIFLVAGPMASRAWAQRNKEHAWECIDKARQTAKLTTVLTNTLEGLVITACDMRYEPLPPEGPDIAAKVIEEVRSFQRDSAQALVAPARPSQQRPFW
jgi:hypothetical protein